MFDNIIENQENEIINSLQELIKVPSVNQMPEVSMPFGKSANEALEKMLELGQSLGFRTKNVDGYCGYIEFGEGDKLLGIIGHLDVVPEGENWTYPPFSATIADGKIYGRGAIDDKGPVIASLYAMKVVKDYCESHKIKLNKRVRLILGLNEENNWKCIEYYKTHEEIPSIGFSPDADFPCIYAEKGILSPILQMTYTPDSNANLILKSIDCNNNPLNVVPKISSCVLSVNSIDINEVISLLEKFINENKFKIDIQKFDDYTLKLTSYGVQAHSAHPDLGVNSVSRLIVTLNYIFNKYNLSIPLFEFFNTYIGTGYDGYKLGINFSDESGALTLNVGRVSLENNLLKIGMNLRIPINTAISEIKDIFLEKIYEPIECNFIGEKAPLYVSKDSKLVTTLCEIFNNKTNSNFGPIAIGGATYARAFPNCVSFGANVPGQKDMCHQTDEFISIDNLILATKIYAEAIFEL